MNARKKLSIGVQTFRQIREEGYYYVVKTPFVAQLADRGKYYFLSRPHRFGKSLFLDTLAEAFAGNAALFDGLMPAKSVASARRWRRKNNGGTVCGASFAAACWLRRCV